MLQLQVGLEELAEENIQVRMQSARDEHAAALADEEKASSAIEAAQRELAGAEAGDGRDESNRTLQERLADTENSQVTTSHPL